MKKFLVAIGLLLVSGIFLDIPGLYVSSTLYQRNFPFILVLLVYSVLTSWVFKIYTAKFDIGKWKVLLWLPFIGWISVIPFAPLNLLLHNIGILRFSPEFSDDDLGGGVLILIISTFQWFSLLLGSYFGFSEREHPKA